MFKGHGNGYNDHATYKYIGPEPPEAFYSIIRGDQKKTVKRLEEGDYIISYVTRKDQDTIVKVGGYYND